MTDGRVPPRPVWSPLAVSFTPKPANLANAINGHGHIEFPIDSKDLTLVVDGDPKPRAVDWTPDTVEISLSRHELGFIRQGEARHRDIAGATLRFRSKEATETVSATGGGSA